MKAGKPFPWAEAMQFAFARLHLSPQAFWSMTMRELNCALGMFAENHPPPMGRENLDALMQQHPDRMTNGNPDRHVHHSG